MTPVYPWAYPSILKKGGPCLKQVQCGHATNYELLLIPLLAHSNSFSFYFWLIPNPTLPFLQVIFLMLLQWGAGNRDRG
jgi:hypothetical protein